MSKGTRRERQAAEIYKRAGYAVYRPATVQYGQNDVFGLFDLLAVNPDANRVHAVQVKSNRATGIQAWTKHTQLFRECGWRTVYLCPYDNAGWRWIDVDRATRTEYDERERPVSMGEGLVEYLDPRSGPA